MKITKFLMLSLLLSSLCFISCDNENVNPDTNTNSNNINISINGLSISCIGNKDTTITGEGEVITKTLSLEDFDKVDFMFGKKLTISQGTTQEVKVTGQANIIDRLKTDVIDGKWTITAEDGCYEDYELSVEIIIPNLKASNFLWEFRAQNG